MAQNKVSVVIELSQYHAVGKICEAQFLRNIGFSTQQ